MWSDTQFVCLLPHSGTVMSNPKQPGCQMQLVNKLRRMNIKSQNFKWFPISSYARHWNEKHLRLKPEMLSFALKRIIFCQVLTIFNSSKQYSYTKLVRTSQRTQYFFATKANRLILFWEKNAVYGENDTKHINSLCVQNEDFKNVKAGGEYSDHWL
jgi:hypothetical protein